MHTITRIKFPTSLMVSFVALAGCTDLLALDLSPLAAAAATDAAASTAATTPAASDASDTNTAAAPEPTAAAAAVTAAAAAPSAVDQLQLVWRVVSKIPPRDPLSSEGVSIVALPKATALAAFGGYNGKYQNVLSIILAADLQVSWSQNSDAAKALHGSRC